MAPDAKVVLAQGGSPNDTETITFKEFVARSIDDIDVKRLVWITITAGVVMTIEQQWVP